MKKKWLTKIKDMHIAHMFMDEYARKQQVEALGLFEVVVNQHEKSMDFRMANWVLALAKKFNTMYGANQGEHVMRQVITCCLTQDQTLH